MSSTKTVLFRLLPWVLIAVVGALVWQHQQRQASHGIVHTLNCANLQQGCVINVNGNALRIALVGPLKPLQAFRASVVAPRAGKITAHFTMEGMDMGFNLYTLRRQSQGQWEATITLPVCVTGRRDWAMNLDVDGMQIRVPFVTDM